LKESFSKGEEKKRSKRPSISPGNENLFLILKERGTSKSREREARDS